jgi:8-hydroxy-5-deazaflavin:NADPH oxidoreductase
MRLAIIGTGVIGTTIGRRWLEHGHTVAYGVREPVATGTRPLPHRAVIDRIPDAVSSADSTLVAIPGGAVENLLATHGSVLDGKLLIDATNDVAAGSFHHIPLYEARLPGARVYRAFNTLGSENFADPTIDGQQADLFYAGPPTDDRHVIEQLIADVGLRPVYVGQGAAGADLLDGLTRLWFALAVGQSFGRHLAFKTLRVSPPVGP